MEEIEQIHHQAAPQSSVSTTRQHPTPSWMPWSLPSNPSSTLGPNGLPPAISLREAPPRMQGGHELTHPPQPSCVLLGPSAGRAWRRTLFSQHPDYGKLSSPLQSLSYWFLSSPLCTVLESGQCLEKKMNQVFESPAFISVCVSLAPWEGTSLSSAAASTRPGLDSGLWKTPEKISHWSPWLSLLHNLVPSCSHCFSCSPGIQMDDKKYIYIFTKTALLIVLGRRGCPLLTTLSYPELISSFSFSF